jgi:hypothetical protein
LSDRAGGGLFRGALAAPPPAWLQDAWAGAKRRGLEALTLDDINAEIDAHRRETDGAGSGAT